MFAEPEFWVMVSFVVFVAVAFRPLRARLNEALDARAEKIRETLDEAQRLREEAQAALAAYQRQQRDGLKEAAAIVEHARTEAERIAEEARIALEDSLKRREALALEKIRMAEEESLKEVRNTAVEVALGASRRLIEAHLDTGRDEALVERTLAELPNKL
jgi:F-type H+-transporting ATPase subunit b